MENKNSNLQEVNFGVAAISHVIKFWASLDKQRATSIEPPKELNWNSIREYCHDGQPASKVIGYQRLSFMGSLDGHTYGFGISFDESGNPINGRILWDGKFPGLEEIIKYCN